MTEATRPTIPTIIDSVKRYTDFAMTRCIYFCIEAIEPVEASFTDLDLPCLAFGPSAIIYTPAEGRRFTTPESVADLFGRIEQRSELIVDSEELWLPNVVFAATTAPARGNVYRIGMRLFSLANEYGLGRRSRKEFSSLVRQEEHRAAYSGSETEAFLAWGRRQIEESRKNYYRQDQENINLEFDPKDSPQRRESGS